MRFVLLCCFLVNTCLAEFSIKEALNQIPQQDKKRIERLFKYLIYNEPFAYTLFGSKPLSFTGCPMVIFQCYPFFYVDYSVCLKGDWAAWQKYKHLFPIEKFAFFNREYDAYFEINLLNLEQGRNIIARYLELFQKKINCRSSSEKLLTEIQNCPDIYECLGNSQALYGTLLGFGKNNSLLFENYYSHKMYFLTPLTLFNKESLISLYQIPLPDFAVFESEETEQLRKNYKEERARIIDIYSQGDFLEITLHQLTSKYS